MFVLPTIANFKEFFARDFPFAPAAPAVDPDAPPVDPAPAPDLSYIQDFDITNAMRRTRGFLNQGLAGDQDEFDLMYLNLTAHYLVMSLRGSSAGMSGGFAGLETSKSVGSVSVSSTLPSFILENPMLALLAQTQYGTAYLEMMLPNLIGGGFGCVGGATLP